MNKQKGFTNILLIVFVVVLAGVAGYFALKNRSVTPTPIPFVDEQPTPSQSPTLSFKPTTTIASTPLQPSPTPIRETTNWKTYTNTKYGFGVNIPKEWTVKTVSNELFFYSGSTDVTPDVHFAFNQNYMSSFTGPKSIRTINGLQWTAGLNEVSGWHYEITHINNTYTFQTQFNNEKKLTEFLSTFKLTIPTVALKSYTSPALNVSFKYPANWTIKEETVFPGSAQSETTITLTNDSDVIYSFVKRDCVQNYTYCNAVGDRWPSFSTRSTNPEVRLVIDGIIKTAI